MDTWVVNRGSQQGHVVQYFILWVECEFNEYLFFFMSVPHHKKPSFKLNTKINIQSLEGKISDSP